MLNAQIKGKSKKRWPGLALLMMILALALSLSGCGVAVEVAEPGAQDKPAAEQPTGAESGESAGSESSAPPVELSPLEALLAEAESYVEEGGRYTAPEEVAAYLHLYGELPENFITKRDAGDLGWESNKGNLWEVTDEMSIGGDYFGNREGRLPDKDGRKWFECDVNYEGGYRGAERLVFSNDGLIYYTEDHYESFIQFY
ncbi:ribonuclease domain-containing protein [Acidaminobacter hydrogenoformans]|uniref:Ribonuclease n=1 Tax=Acidaminobacter hydrogenoformans DSM 2784 TaxID=1120920 RepID=A0A1G5RVD6_9FIRM|nr:ribonuclease domain-containing protein [Acidaminobacter hydrogenoformans]SCZ77867.1 ribonuclease [Acidaminobacter hydrogenoformans DSM 2784]